MISVIATCYAYYVIILVMIPVFLLDLIHDDSSSCFTSYVFYHNRFVIIPSTC